MPAFFGPAGSQGDSFDAFLARFLQAQQGGQRGRPVDVTRLLTRRTHEVINAAASFASEHGHPDVDALHILRVMLTTEAGAAAIRQVGADPDKLIAAVDERLPEAGPQRPDSAPSLTGSAQRALLDAVQVARAFGSTYVAPEHLFLSFVLSADSPAGRLLAAAGITQETLQQADQQGPGPAMPGQAQPGQQGQGSMLEQYGHDLTEQARSGGLDPVIGRADEIEQTIEILARRTKNNPVLIGEAGVGKTAIVEGLAQAIAADEVPAQLQGKRLIALDLAAMIAGTRYRGDFEERLTGAIDEIVADGGRTIVFLDELHTVVGAGGSGESNSMDAGNILKPRLARGELHLIGATTLNEYRSIEKDSALERRFQPVTVGEPSVEDAVQILDGLQQRYADHHGITYTPEGIRAAVELSHRYLTDRFLPDKAIDLIDQAGARLSLRRPRADVAALRNRVAELEASKSIAIKGEDYERASELRDLIRGVEQRLQQATEHPEPADDAPQKVGPDEIAAVLERATGIPAARMTETQKTRLANLEDELHTRVIGQDEAVGAVARSIRRSRTGLGDPSRPVGSFLFLGPTGVGKTELSKSLAANLFDDESAMIRFDMSEFSERHTASRLVGAPPGYVGYDDAGQLTEQVRRRPYSVVLLDEIEKAHPDVFNLLLQVLDDGRLTDGRGRTVDFRNTVLIMTSNLGSQFWGRSTEPLGFGTAATADATENLRHKVMGAVRDAMRPEFLNRIDETVLFSRLGRDQLHQIVRLQLRQTSDRLAAQGITLAVDDDAVDWIAETGYEPEYGARPLRRLIQRQLEDRIAELLVGESVGEGDTVTVGVHDDELRITSGAMATA